MAIQKVRLGDICEFVYGKGLPKNERVSGEFPVYGSGGIVDNHKNYYVKGPGIIVGRKGSIGSVFFEKRNFYPIDTVFFITEKQKVYDLGFLYYSLLTLGLDKLNTDAAVPGLNRNVAYEQNILLPDISAQHKIASILSAYDDLIENNNRRIKILEEMAQAIYREWFVNFRFPGHEKVKMVSPSPLGRGGGEGVNNIGKIPEGWEVKKLGDIAEVNKHSIRKDNIPAEIIYIDISSVSTGSIDQKTHYKFTDAPGRARRKVSHGDIIWSSVRPNRKSYALIIDPESNWIVSTGFAVISAIKIPYTYLYKAVTTDDFVGYLTNNARGAAYPAVNTEDYEKAKILLPANNVIQKYHEIVEPLFLQRNALQRKAEFLCKTRDLLLPKLISGEIDVGKIYA